MIKKRIKEIFSDDYLVNSNVLNLLGIQPIRYVLSRAIYFLRGFLFTYYNSKEVKILRKEGLLILKNFLDDKSATNFTNDFENLQKLGNISKLIDGESNTIRSTITIEQCKENESLKKIVFSEKLIKILEAVERKIFLDNNFHNSGKYGQVVWLDIIENLGGNGNDDSQKTLHSDTFFHTHKVWYFPFEVDDSSGPLYFVKGTHKFSFHKLFLEYINSISNKTNKDSAQVRGDKQNLKSYEKKIERCTVPANTLVIADTTGYHSRGLSKKFSKRYQLHFRVRRNPFSQILIN